MNGITSRENAQQTILAFGHKDGADASVAHVSAGLSHPRAWGKRDRRLIPDHLRHVSHYQVLRWRSAFWRAAFLGAGSPVFPQFYLDDDVTN